MTRRRVVKPALTLAARRDQWDEMARQTIEYERLRQQKEQARALRLEEELARDKRPRWMREHVVDPEWIKAYKDTRPYPKDHFILDVIRNAIEHRLNLLFNNKELLEACIDVKKRESLYMEHDGRNEIALGVETLIDSVLKAVEDAKGNPDADVRKRIGKSVKESLDHIRDGLSFAMQDMLAEDDEYLKAKDRMDSQSAIRLWEDIQECYDLFGPDDR
jgi:hypothetical protein